MTIAHEFIHKRKIKKVYCLYEKSEDITFLSEGKWDVDEFLQHWYTDFVIKFKDDYGPAFDHLHEFWINHLLDRPNLRAYKNGKLVGFTGIEADTITSIWIAPELVKNEKLTIIDGFISFWNDKCKFPIKAHVIETNSPSLMFFFNQDFVTSGNKIDLSTLL